jgi:hypothetical protein
MSAYYVGTGVIIGLVVVVLFGKEDTPSERDEFFVSSNKVTKT